MMPQMEINQQKWASLFIDLSLILLLLFKSNTKKHLILLYINSYCSNNVIFFDGTILMSYFQSIMPDQQLFLLQLLKIPVIVIKFISNVVSILTYVPNYFALFCVDYVVFDGDKCGSLRMYCFWWVPRFVILNVGVAFFLLQFYCVFCVMELSGKEVWIQGLAMVLSLGGLLILMRKGYTTMITKYKLSKLKSPFEHLMIYVDFALDLFGLALFLLNSLMLVHLHQSFNYDYHPTHKYRFITHISNLIKKSLITYLSFFYVHIFFALFPWRYLLQKHTADQEKQNNKLLNYLVLLTLIYLSTIIDIIVILLFSLPNIIHPKRTIYYENLHKSVDKVYWKITLNHFAFVIAQLAVILITIPCLPFQWSLAKQNLSLLSTEINLETIHSKQLKRLLKKTLLKIPFLYCNFWIWVFRYKYAKKEKMSADVASKKIAARERESITFQCFGEQCAESLFYIPIAIATVLRIWNIGWLKYVLDNDYNIDKAFVFAFFIKSIIHPILFLFSLILLTFQSLYDFSTLFTTYNASKHNYNAHITRIHDSQKTHYQKQKQKLLHSHLEEFAANIFTKFLQDIWYVPCFFVERMTLFTLLDEKVKPENISFLFDKILMLYYFQSVKSSVRFEKYMQFYSKANAAGQLKNDELKMYFWQYAKKCERHLLFQNLILRKMLPKKIVGRIEESLVRGDKLSQISNEYWYRYETTIQMLRRLLFLIIEVIVTVFGVVFMLPLTLWRLPTFIILYKHHNTKKMFFTILFTIYKQLAIDLLHFLIKFAALLASPRHFLKFLYKTSFRYGDTGMTDYWKVQNKKMDYLITEVIVFQVFSFTNALGSILIKCLWIRSKQLKIRMKQAGYTWKTLAFHLFKSVSVPDLNIIIGNKYGGQSIQLSKVQAIINPIFREALIDIPYFFIIFILLITMPWRINYVIQAIKEMREDPRNRSKFHRFFRKIFQDYFCIFLNMFLLLSGFKTKRAVQLIKRNYRLNFFIGFLPYSYMNDLKIQVKQLFFIYIDILLLGVAVIFGWTRASLIVKELQAIHKKRKEFEEGAKINEKIRDNTVKENKELKTLDKMGFYAYMSMCSYLSVPQLMKLRQVSQFNYLMSKREEIWLTKWESSYVGKHNVSAETFEEKCIIAYRNELQLEGQKVDSYHEIILKHFDNNVFKENVDFKLYLQAKISPPLFRTLFYDYTYTIHEGYGPENQLPQSDHQDQDFLRLTNQVRRPKLQYSENLAYINWLAQKPIEKVAQTLHRYFRVDLNRRRKQLIFLVILLGLVLSYFSFFYIFSNLYFQIDRFIAIKALLTAYFHALMFFTWVRCQRLQRDWISLRPFDIYYDIKNFIIRCKDVAMDKVLTPTGNFIHKCAHAVKSYAIILANYVKKAADATGNFTSKYANLFYQKVILPLYISIAHKLRLFKDLFVKIIKGIFNSITFLFGLVGSFFKSIFAAITTILSNLNNLYYQILKHSMHFFLKFGLLGNLIFTIYGLVLMCIPSLICFYAYRQKWYILVSTIHTMILLVLGYKHLNKIRKET